MNRTIRTTAAALGVGALLAGGLAVSQAVAAPDDPTEPPYGIGNAYGPATGGSARGAAFGMGRNTRAAGTTSQTATADQDLTEALAFSREEERLARDLYAAIADRYDGARPFSMITNSEQKHFDQVGVLLDRYGVDDPSDGLPAGEYADPALQDLYDGWWADAQESLDAAYQVGIALEERDIADLRAMIAADYPSDVDATLANLLRGSENHLAAYQRAADGTLGDGPATQYRSGQGRTGTPMGRGGPAAGMGGAGYDGDCPMVDTDDDA
jgi:hypothetical protein